MSQVKKGLQAFFGAVGSFFKEFGQAAAKGDLFVKLSLIGMGAGYIRRKQFVKGILMTIFEVAVIWYTLGFAM